MERGLPNRNLGGGAKTKLLLALFAARSVFVFANEVSCQQAVGAFFQSLYEDCRYASL
jgi:hypothetical protein